jgi:hypothetical protein
MPQPLEAIAARMDDVSGTPLSRLETRLGVFATSLWAFVAFIADAGALVAAKDSVVLVSIAMICIVMQGFFVLLVWGSIRLRHPQFGIGVVRRQPRLELPMQILVALAWVLQFFSGCLYALLAEGIIGNSETQIPARFWFMKVLITFACSYATFIYLLLAVGTLVRSDRILHAMWRWRFVIDGILTVLLLLPWRIEIPLPPG